MQFRILYKLKHTETASQNGITQLAVKATWAVSWVHVSKNITCFWKAETVYSEDFKVLLITTKASEPPYPEEELCSQAVISLFLSLFVLIKHNHTFLFLVSKMTGSTNYVEMTILK